MKLWVAALGLLGLVLAVVFGVVAVVQALNATVLHGLSAWLGEHAVRAASSPARCIPLAVLGLIMLRVAMWVDQTYNDW